MPLRNRTSSPYLKDTTTHTNCFCQNYDLETDLSLLTYIVDLHYTEGDSLFTNEEHMRITYAICHLASMSSAITNPFLYGYMNENFR